MCPFNPRDQERLASNSFSPTDLLASALNQKAPWDSIVEFATSDAYCGFPLFPRQATLLRLIFLETEQMTAYDIETIEEWRKGFQRHRDVYGVQPDIWQRVEYLKERGYRRFPYIQAVLGRRASKGVLGGFLGCEQIAFLHSLDNPQAVYGIAEGKDLYGNIGATSQTVAQRQQFADIRTMVERCKYFRPKNAPPWIAESKDSILRVRTAADVRLIAENKAAKIPIDHQIATLCAVALSASSVAGRGATSFFNVFDEFAFHVQTGSSKSDSEIFKDWQPSLGQFGIDGLTYVPSSPATKAGYFYILYEMGKVLMSTYRDDTGMREEAQQQLVNAGHVMEEDAEPTWLIFQGSSFSLYEDWRRTPEILGLGYAFNKPPEPELTDERQIRERRRDPEKFRVEKGGQFAEVIGAYLDPDAVDRMFLDPGWREPLAPQSYGIFARKYRIHCDPGRSGANFSLAIGHLEDAPPDEHGRVWPHVIFDLLHVWRPMDFPEDPETHKQTIDYVQVHSDIEGIVSRFMSTEKISFDQWNCLSGGSLISTPSGIMHLGDYVDADGLLRPGQTVNSDLPIETADGIANIGAIHHKGVVPTLVLDTKPHYSVEVTGEHLIWVRPKKKVTWDSYPKAAWMKAEDVCVGDQIEVVSDHSFPDDEVDLRDLRPTIKTKTGYEGVSKVKNGYYAYAWSSAEYKIVYLGTFKNAEEAARVSYEWRQKNPTVKKCTRFPATCTVALAEALGLLSAEGARGSHDFSSIDKECLVRYVENMQDCFGGSWHYSYDEDQVLVRGQKHPVGVVRGGDGTRLGTFLNDLGLVGLSPEKIVPSVIFRSPRNVVAAYLRGLFEGDGHISHRDNNGGGNVISLDTTSQKMADQVHYLLLALGIYSTKWSGTYMYKGQKRPQYRVHMYGPDIQLYSEKIGFISNRKSLTLAELLADKQENPGRGVGLRLKNSITDRGGRWITITSIVQNEADCYDICVPRTEHFLANGIVTHNSASFLASLKQKFSPGIRVTETTFTEKTNQDRCEKFKAALNLGWLHTYTDNFYMDNMSCLLELECKFLAEKNNKVIKQDVGPVTTKDLFDSVCVVTVDLLHDALDRYSAEVMTAGAYGSTWTAGLKSGREQERQAEGLALRNGNKAYEVLNTAKRDRARARLQGRGRVGYQPDRLSSIHVRPPKMPK